MNKKLVITLTLSLLVVLIVVILLIFVFRDSTPTSTELPRDGEPTVEDDSVGDRGLSPAREIPDDIEDPDHDPMEGLTAGVDGVGELPSVIFNLFGTITQRGSDFLIINTRGQHMESGEDTQVRVTITGERIEYIGEGEDREEISVSGTTILNSGNNEISFQDLNIGSRVSIESPENIKNQTNIVASTIKIIE